MNKWIIPTSIAALTALVAMAEAVPPPGDRAGVGPRQGPPSLVIDKLLDNPEIVQKAGLTEEQVTQVREVLYQDRKVTIQLKADHQLAELEVRHLMAQPAPDEAAVIKAVEEAGRLATELQKADVRRQIKLEQIVGKEKLAEIRSTLGGYFQDARASRFGPGGPGRGPGGPNGSGGPGGPGFNRGGNPDQRPPWMQDEMPPPNQEEPAE